MEFGRVRVNPGNFRKIWYGAYKISVGIPGGFQATPVYCQNSGAGVVSGDLWPQKAFAQIGTHSVTPFPWPQFGALFGHDMPVICRSGGAIGRWRLALCREGFRDPSQKEGKNEQLHCFMYAPPWLQACLYGLPPLPVSEVTVKATRGAP